MAAPLNICTTIKQRGVVRFSWAKNMDAAKDIHKEMLPVCALYRKVKVKVNFTIEQATKPNKGIRGVDLLFL
jgi:hypothetical protein